VYKALLKCGLDRRNLSRWKCLFSDKISPLPH